MIAAALRESWREGSLISSLPANAMAGLTVGIIALPLSMGLAIASGVPPQHGLYTAIIGGLVIALLGGSRVNISGPTAAFVVVLLPVVQAYGLGGLLISGAMAGLIMIGFGLMRLGGLIQLIPYPVVVGFTSGIGTVIALLQLKDFLGLQISAEASHFPEKLWLMLLALPSVRWQEVLVGCASLALLILWRRLPTRMPAYLVALIGGTALGALFNHLSMLPAVDTIASRFHYVLDGVTLAGVPALAPQFSLPWQLPGADGAPLVLGGENLRALLGAAFAIALLGALESLLCAVVADGMTGRQHNPDSELIGVGAGNLLVAFFGGIPATAAIARTASNVRAGATTPVAAIVHALFVLAAMLLLAPLLSLIPMAAMAAVLLMVAWNMSEAPHALRILRRAPRADAAVLLSCFSLTVLIDMQVAVAAGVALASLLFMRRMTELTASTPVPAHGHRHQASPGPGVVVYDLDGPLFFGAAHKALKVIATVDRQVHTVVLDLADVSVLDTTAMMNLESLAADLAARKTRIFVTHVKAHLAEKMQRYGLFDHGIALEADLSSVLARSGAQAPPASLIRGQDNQ